MSIGCLTLKINSWGCRGVGGIIEALSGLKIKGFPNTPLPVQWVVQDLVLVSSEAINGVSSVGKDVQVVFLFSHRAK